MIWKKIGQKKWKKTTLFFSSLFYLMYINYACNDKAPEKKIDRSFYYWKSVAKLSDFELHRLDSLKVSTIYLKFFDVDWDDATGSSIPVAKLQMQNQRLPIKFHIIPTVFIANRCIQKIDSVKTVVLAHKIYKLIQQICTTYQIIPVEYQIDCDWTAITREKYFSLLQIIKQESNKNISATIRLHQIKFLSRSGVPPVSRGLLMCYNMGNLKNPDTKNSIIEIKELKKYVGNLSAYPLPLDVAFSLFDWKVLFRNNKYEGLLANMPSALFTNTFSLTNDDHIEILKDTILSGYELKKGDMLRQEKSTINELLSAAIEINQHLKSTSFRVSLYHLDSVTLNKYTTNELESIYNCFR